MMSEMIYIFIKIIIVYSLENVFLDARKQLFTLKWPDRSTLQIWNFWDLEKANNSIILIFSMT